MEDYSVESRIDMEDDDSVESRIMIWKMTILWRAGLWHGI